jgi:signal transduction histidine kinase
MSTEPEQRGAPGSKAGAPTDGRVPATDCEERVRTLEVLVRRREEELQRLTRELEDTNRGVVALYAELDEQAEKLKRSDAMKSRFLSNMSHEFRTPLSSIRALCRLLQGEADGPLGAEQSRQVALIRKAADDLSEMVGDLLDLAKIEAGKAVLKISVVVVDSLFAALRATFKPMVHADSLVLVFEPAPGLQLMTDEAKLSQILRNLISNALKYTPAGEVRVACRACPGSELEFSVSDTGIGIAPEHQQVVFEEFVQIENDLQSHTKGTGLGLPLCRQLCELLCGRIRVASVPGAGSTFSLRLPRQLENIAADTTSSEASSRLEGR